MCEVSCNKLSETSVDDVIHAQGSSCWYSHSEKIVVENDMCSKPNQIVFVLHWGEMLQMLLKLCCSSCEQNINKSCFLKLLNVLFNWNTKGTRFFCVINPMPWPKVRILELGFCRWSTQNYHFKVDFNHWVLQIISLTLTIWHCLK